MLEVVESKYLRELYEDRVKEYKELYQKAKQLLEEKGEDAKWNRFFTVKDVIDDFKTKASATYDDFVKSYDLIDRDVAVALNKYGEESEQWLIIYRIMEKTGCTYGEARNCHYSKFVKYLKDLHKYNKILIDKYGLVLIDDKLFNIINEEDDVLSDLCLGRTFEHCLSIVYLPVEVAKKVIGYLDNQ